MPLTLEAPRRRTRRSRVTEPEAPLFAPEVLAAERRRREAVLERTLRQQTSPSGPLDEPPTVLEPAEVAALLAGLHEQLLAADAA